MTIGDPVAAEPAEPVGAEAVGAEPVVPWLVDWLAVPALLLDEQAATASTAATRQIRRFTPVLCESVIFPPLVVVVSTLAADY
jgi:hypothetical protein